MRNPEKLYVVVNNGLFLKDRDTLEWTRELVEAVVYDEEPTPWESMTLSEAVRNEITWITSSRLALVTKEAAISAFLKKKACSHPEWTLTIVKDEIIRRCHSCGYYELSTVSWKEGK